MNTCLCVSFVLTSLDFFAAGVTPLDSKYFQAQNNRQRYEKQVVLPHIQDQDTTEEQDIPASKRRKFM